MDNDFKLVQQTGKRMATQNNRHTQYPLYAIQTRIKRAPSIYEDASGTDIGDDGEELPFVYEHVFDLKAGIFLTEHAALQHIASNNYHYDKPQVFCVSAWRNPEMQAVMRQIIKAGDEDVPSHYTGG